MNISQGRVLLWHGYRANATQVKRRLVWTSYGIAMVALPFLEEVEQINLQALNLFWYQIAISRVQTIIYEACPMFFYWCNDYR